MEKSDVFEMPVEYKAILEDKAFLEKVEQASNADEIVSLFETKGISVSKDIAQEVFEIQGEELSETELEDIAGGGVIGAVAVGSISGYIWSKATYTIVRKCGGSVNTSLKAARAMGTVGAGLGGGLGVWLPV